MEIDFEERRNQLLIEGRWAELVEVLEHEKKERQGKERTEILEELGSIYLEHLDNPDLAFRVWDEMFQDKDSENLVEPYCSQILEKNPGYEPALHRLEPILRTKGDEQSLKKLASLFLDLADTNTDETSTFIGYQKQAAAIFEGLSEHENAYLVLSSALRADSLGSLFDDLERLSHIAGKVPDFVTLFHDELVGAPQEIATPFFKRLGMLALEVDHIAEATTLLRNAAKAFPHDPQIPKTLNRLYRQSGDWDVAVNDLENQLENAVDFAHQKELRAELKTVYGSAAVASSGSKAASYFSKRAELALDHKDLRGAQEDWQNALQKDPRFVPALNNLIAHFGALNSPADTIDKLGRLIARVDQEVNILTSEVLKARLLEYARLLKSEPAITSMHTETDLYRRAYELDVNDFEIAFFYGISLFEAQMHENALRMLSRVIDNKVPLEQSQIATLFSAAASSALHQNEKKLAWEWIQKALSLEPNVLSSWHIYKTLSDDNDQLSSRVESREKIVSLTSNQSEKEKNQIELGDIWLAANRPDFAMEALNKALELHPNSVAVLRKQLVILQNLKKWDPLIRVLEQLVELEVDSKKKSNYLYTIAILYRNELENIEGAVHFFNLSLDAAPGFLKAFEAIDRIFTDRRLWTELEKAYRKMLARLGSQPGDEDLKFLLFKNLGEVYRTRLNDIPNAVAAYETALTIRHEDQEITSILAQLYGQSGAGAGIEKLRDVYRQNPQNIKTIETLFGTYLAAEQYDAAFCISSVLKSKGSSHRESLDFHARYFGENIKVAVHTFFPELLELMYHEGLDRSVSSFMAIVSYAIREPYGKTIKDWGVSEKDEVNLRSPEHRFTKVFTYVSGLVGPQPFTKLYLRSDHRVGLRNMFCDPPSILIGSEILEPIDSRAAAFQCAKVLAGLRPELYLAHAGFSVEHLNLFFLSALEFGLDRKPSTGKNGAAVFKCLKKLPKPIKMQLRSMAVFLEKVPPPDLSRWTDLADFSSSRFALLVCGDVETASHCLRDSQNAIGSTTLAQKHEDILRFGMSENYFKVRDELGLSLF